MTREELLSLAEYFDGEMIRWAGFYKGCRQREEWLQKSANCWAIAQGLRARALTPDAQPSPASTPTPESI